MATLSFIHVFDLNALKIVFGYQTKKNHSNQPKHKNAFEIQLAFNWIMDVIRGLPAHPGGMVGGAVGVGGSVGTGVGSSTVRDEKKKKQPVINIFVINTESA